jgi:hypothetical protein
VLPDSLTASMPNPQQKNARFEVLFTVSKIFLMPNSK